MDKMTIWDAVKQPPKSVLKQIGGGRLKGMTDINPQWRYQVMTEQFGVCGIGWKYMIQRVWSEPTSDGQVFAFAEIALQIKVEEVWREPIPGIGGSMLIAKESGGLHANDEAYKMAITDALSVAMKMLGVGADIYAGLWDGIKYKDDGEGDGKGEDKTKKVVEPPLIPPKEHWCKEHNTFFFKKGAMKSFAHPIQNRKEGDKEIWCYEHRTPQQLSEAAITLNTGGELTAFALKHGWTIEKIKSVLGIEKSSDIKDVKVAAVVLFPRNYLTEEAKKLIKEGEQ